MKNGVRFILFLTAILLFGILGVFLGRNLPDLRVGLERSPAHHATDPSTEETVDADREDLGKININTATKEQLMLLPGIGETLAQNIIEYRQQNGSYENLLDLLNVSGIGQKKLSDILSYISIGG